MRKQLDTNIHESTCSANVIVNHGSFIFNFIYARGPVPGVQSCGFAESLTHTCVLFSCYTYLTG